MVQQTEPFRTKAEPGPASVQSAAMAVARTLDIGARSLLRHTSAYWPALSRAHDFVVLRHRMRRALGYKPDLRSPRTYNEKLAWRMLNDRNPLLTLTTDKVAVRQYVASKVGEDVLVPLIAVYDRAEDIRWDELPSSFVLKASHGCNMNLIVRDKDAEDPDLVRRRAADWLRHNFYEDSREWAYRDIPPRLLVEELMLDDLGEVPFDFKFLVFAGRTAVIRVHLDRFGDHRVNFYDRDLRLLPVRQFYPTDPSYQPPAEVVAMAGLAEKIAEDFEYARIDLYLVGGRVRFGEITHHDGNAAQRFDPASFDTELGALWDLPSLT